MAGLTLLLVVGLTALETGSVHAGGLAGLFNSRKAEQSEQMQAAALVPLEQIPAAYRDKVSRVLARPTLYAKGPLETFEGAPDLYRWFLDHPDRTVVAWKRLGAKCLEIENRGQACFGWADSQGSDIVWTTILDGPTLRVWFAEGQVKPGTLFPLVPVQCVVILRHGIINQEKASALMQHQTDIFAYTDSKTAALITRMMGPSVPRMAKQGAGQLQLFFGAMAWYCCQHPDRVETLLRPQSQPSDPAMRLESPFIPGGAVHEDASATEKPLAQPR
jgi:hypothetical protein